MSRIFITGSADGLGKLAAQALLADGHEVVVHVRSKQRLASASDVTKTGAKVIIGDLSDVQQTKDIADQANDLGPFDAVIHNAGVYSGTHLLAVNVMAPYLLTALIHRPKRLIYLSSRMHFGGQSNLAKVDWRGQHETATYSDTKLFVTTFAFAIARLWPSVVSSAVDPGWVPTKMGGATAPDDLHLGHLTQEWLATSNDPDALVSGQYWHHKKTLEAHSMTRNRAFQDELVEELQRTTGVSLPV